MGTRHGLYYYRDDTLQFPFTARCIAKRATSPLQANDEVEIIGMPSEEVCEHEMFVRIRWKDDELAAPLAQLKSMNNFLNYKFVLTPTRLFHLKTSSGVKPAALKT